MDDLLPKKVSKEEKIGALIDNAVTKAKEAVGEVLNYNEMPVDCLLYTSDAADE